MDFDGEKGRNAEIAAPRYCQYVFIKKGKSGRDMFFFLEREGEDFVSMINIMLDFIF